MSVLNVRIVCTTPHNVPFIDASLWDLSGILSHLTAWQVHLRERELVSGAVYIIRKKPGWVLHTILAEGCLYVCLL